MSSEFGRMFFLVGTVIVIAIVWQGYYRNTFRSSHAWMAIAVFVTYMTSFLLYRYITAHIEMHMEHQPLYVVLASIHGTISLSAIVLACVIFARAAASHARGENYFRSHRITSLLLVTLWPLALISGLLI